MGSMTQFFIQWGSSYDQVQATPKALRQRDDLERPLPHPVSVSNLRLQESFPNSCIGLGFTTPPLRAADSLYKEAIALYPPRPIPILVLHHTLLGIDD
jgi:hypothetical protein